MVVLSTLRETLVIVDGPTVCKSGKDLSLMPTILLNEWQQRIIMTPHYY